MPYVKINETDNTIYRNVVSEDDNIVLIPGVAITGPTDVPVLCTSYIDFINTFGRQSPVTNSGSYGTSWHYAANLLLAGMSVLYYRLGTDGLGNSLLTNANADIKVNIINTFVSRIYTLDNVDVTNTVTDEQKAQYDAWVESGSDGDNPVSTYIDGHNDVENSTSSEQIVANIKDKFGGSYGNTYAYTLSITNVSVLLKIYTLNVINKITVSTLLETIKLADISDIPVTSANYSLLVAERIVSSCGGIVNGVAPIVEGDYVYVVFDNTNNNLVTALSYLTNISDLVKFTGGNDADNDTVLSNISSIYSKLSDKYLYDFKFITSGGFIDEYDGTNTYPIAKAMISLAESRQDCVAIIDPNLSIPSSDIKSYYENFNSSYATGYAPWVFMKTDTNDSLWMPPSFVFLYTLAKSLGSGNPLWNPPAGVNRATVSNIIRPQYEINSALLDEWQNTDGSQCVNPIMKLRQYGYVIYGQKTLYYIVNNDEGLRSALQELGVRLTANEIKRAINTVSIALTFEQNNIRTWNEFRGRLDPFLAQMKAERGLNSYEIIMDETTTSDADINNNIIRGTVRVSIARAAEKFIIGFELMSSSVANMVESEENII